MSKTNGNESPDNMNKKQLTEFVLDGKYNSLPPEDFMYDRKGPWPQPSPNHPFGEAPGVLHIPFVEEAYWWLKIGSRYVYQWFLTWPASLFKAWSWGGVQPVSDREFSDYFYHTCYAKFMSPTLNDEMQSIFKAYVNPEKKYLVCDFVGMRLLNPVKGVNCEVSRILFEDLGSDIKPIGINLRDYVVTPDDGDLWELGKYIALQAAGNHIVVGTHPRLHFPMDSLNAITKSAVPMWHPLFQLIIPHTELSLKLNYMVLNNIISLLQNKWWMIYAPFPATGESMRNLVVLGYHGIKDNPCYPKYFFPLRGPQKIYSTYGTFHDEYYQVYLEFVKEVLKDVKPNDEVITSWANYVHNEIPTFPDGKEIWLNDNLHHAVASYVWDVSLGHAADHKTYAEIPLTKNPMRVRVASPKTKDKNFKLDRKKVANVIDQTKLIMANKMFFMPVNVSTLMDAQYEFKTKEQQAAVIKFKAALKNLEANLKIKNYMPVDEIPVSIQY